MKTYRTIAGVNLIFFTGITIAMCIVGTSAQKIEKCNVDSNVRVKYKLISENRNTLPSYILMVDIVVKQKDFNREYMVRLANTLTTRYCHDKEISVAIFDDKKAAKTTDMWNYLLGKVESPSLRGFYSLDRDQKRTGIVFSTERGRPHNEVKIELPLK